ncbi:Gfo/Idh/MocA family protein [Limisalsivibrio acetivorans]|uniref:Gfo/Idh/MocA family protein n=1 Tax=Limisalsivibrio acetivorans TaxID=1304888 RepID=UPI0003B3B3BD|nr:Gfo/Idh/MocA family oxidoreductase [Limisalsivibrio acetivorans]
MSLLRFAVVGCGRIAQRYASLLTGDVKGAQLCAVCDTVEERRNEVAERYGLPAYADMHEMAEKEEPDVFCILTPSGLHAEHFMELTGYGKDIIVEKPMALTVEDAEVMIDAAERNGHRLFVVKQNRYNLPVMKLREAVEAGRFGRKVLGTVRVRWCRTQEYYDMAEWRGTWALDGGVLANQSSHHLDLLEWMMGDVVKVSARGKAFLVDTETEDTAVATVEFEDGSFGVVEVTTAARPKDQEGSISILGETGLVEIGGFAVNSMRLWQFTEPSEGDAEVLMNYSENPPNVYGFGHKRYLEDVVRCINEGKEPVIDGHEGLKSLRFINALYESMETGEEVVLNGNHFTHSRLGRK